MSPFGPLPTWRDVRCSVAIRAKRRTPSRMARSFVFGGTGRRAGGETELGAQAALFLNGPAVDTNAMANRFAARRRLHNAQRSWLTYRNLDFGRIGRLQIYYAFGRRLSSHRSNRDSRAPQSLCSTYPFPLRTQKHFAEYCQCVRMAVPLTR